MLSNLNVVLVCKRGGDFDLTDVDLLTYHLRGKFKKLSVVCITDFVEQPDITKFGCGLIPMHPNQRWEGWWSKLNLFSPELLPLRPFLYLDLDTTVIADLEFLDNINKGHLIMLKDFYRPTKPASGMMWIPYNPTKVNKIWEAFIKSPRQNMKRYRGDQDFISAVVTPDNYWQLITDKIDSFKPNKEWRMEFPTDLSVVCFHGYPRIPQAAETVKWVRNYIELWENDEHQ